MLSSTIRLIRRRFHPTVVSRSPRRWTCSLEFYEPPYLKNLKPKTPVYEAITLQIRGYDYPVLENFQKFAHNIAIFMNLNVEMCWAHPGRNFTINKFKPYSRLTDATYKLTMFERNIKLTNVVATKLPLYTEILQTGLPEGTQINVIIFDENHFNDRYVPDHDLNAKKKELEELGGPPPEADTNEFTW